MRGITICLVLLAVFCGTALGRSGDKSQFWGDAYSEENAEEQRAMKLLEQAEQLYGQKDKVDELIETYEQAIAILEKEWGKTMPTL